MNKILLGVVALMSTFIAPAFGHSGGLNSQGCHNNRKTGDYHCHRSVSPPAHNYPSTRSTYPANRSAERSVVKMSRSGICHAPGTSYYAQTMNFTPYLSLDACCSAVGRLPKGNGHYRQTALSMNSALVSGITAFCSSVQVNVLISPSGK